MKIPAAVRDAMQPIVRVTATYREIQRGDLYAVTFDDCSDTPLALLDGGWLTSASSEHPARFAPVNAPARSLFHRAPVPGPASTSTRRG